MGAVVFDCVVVGLEGSETYSVSSALTSEEQEYDDEEVEEQCVGCREIFASVVDYPTTYLPVSCLLTICQNGLPMASSSVGATYWIFAL